MNLLDENDDRFELLGEIVEQSPLGRSARVNDRSTYTTEAEIPAADEDAGDCSSRGSRGVKARTTLFEAAKSALSVLEAEQRITPSVRFEGIINDLRVAIAQQGEPAWLTDKQVADLSEAINIEEDKHGHMVATNSEAVIRAAEFTVLSVNGFNGLNEQPQSKGFK